MNNTSYQYQLTQSTIMLQNTFRENKIVMEKQISKLKRDLYVTFTIIFVFLFSGLTYQLYNIFR